MAGCEYLSADILDSSFVKCFAPIHIVQLVLGSTHADIRDCFIMPTTRSQKIYTLVWFVLVTHSIYLIIDYYVIAYYHINQAVCICLSLGAFLQYVIYATNIIHTRFAGGDTTLNIYLNLQKIDRMLKINEIPHFNRELYRYNCFMVWLVIIVYIPGYCIHIFFCIDGRGICIGLGLMIVYMETILTGNLIYYLGARVKHINGLIRTNIVLKKENNIQGMGHTWAVKDAFKIVTDLDCENKDALTLQKFFVCMNTILKTYQDVTQRFRLPVCMITLLVFVWTFVIIEAIVVGRNVGFLPWVAVATIVLWMIFYYVQLVLLAVTNDWFCRQVRQLKLVCVYALSVYYDGPVFCAATEMIRLVEAGRPVFPVLGGWVLTRALPLSLLALIANNVVVLLQFTL